MKNLHKQITVTAAVAAYNEGQNIRDLLESIVNQEQKSFVLEKIVVISDGSTDDMDEKVRKFAGSYPLVELIADQKRLGKSRRVEEIFRMNKSDIVVLFDGDFLLADSGVLDSMIRHFNDIKVAVVNGNIQPVKPSTFIGGLIYTWYSLWYQIRQSFNHGDLIYNCLSSAVALRSAFAKSISFHEGNVSQGEYIYCLLKSKQLKFRFEKSSIAYFRLPETISDYVVQINRYSNQSKKLTESFGTGISGYYRIPLQTKIKVLAKNILFNPVNTILAGIFILSMSKLHPKPKIKADSKSWIVTTTTKKSMKSVNYKFQ